MKYKIDYSDKGNMPDIPMWRVLKHITDNIWEQVGKSFINEKEAIEFKEKLEVGNK